MSMYSAFKSDSNVEQAGVWLSFGDFRFRIARQGGANKKFKEVAARITGPVQRAIPHMKEEQLVSIYAEIFAEAVIVDSEVKQDGEWIKGMFAEDGSVIEANKANLMNALIDLPDLFAQIKDASEDAALYRADIEAATGN